MNLIAAVGSNEQWNDDIPNAGSATTELSKPTPGVRETDVGRNHLALPKEYKTLPVCQEDSLEGRALF